MTWQILERDALVLEPLAGLAEDLWDTLLELAALQPGTWSLVGGQMVHLHALENATNPPRLSTDLDLVVDARVLSGAIPHFVNAIEENGFVADGFSPDGLAHRYRRSEIALDVLAPEGLGERVDLTTTPPGRTIQIPGGTQALQRTELLPVEVGTKTGLVPRPSLLGAIIVKALAVTVDDVPQAQRLDLAFLLALVEDPIALRAQVTHKDRSRLRDRDELLDPNHPTWRSLSQEAGDRGRATLALLGQ